MTSGPVSNVAADGTTRSDQPLPPPAVATLSPPSPGAIPAPPIHVPPTHVPPAKLIPTLPAQTLSRAAPSAGGEVVTQLRDPQWTGVGLPVRQPEKRTAYERQRPIRLLVWLIIIVVLGVPGYAFVKGFLGAMSEADRDRVSTPSDAEGVVTTAEVTEGAATVGSAATPTTVVDPVCVELEKVMAMSNEMDLVWNSAIQELTISSGQIDEASVLARVRDVANVTEARLPEMLGAYEAAIRAAPEHMVADLRAIADGTAAVMPVIIDVFRNANTIDELAGLEEALARPELEWVLFRAASATLRMDEFTIPTCGFKFSNS